MINLFMKGVSNDLTFRSPELLHKFLLPASLHAQVPSFKKGKDESVIDIICSLQQWLCTTCSFILVHKRIELLHSKLYKRHVK